MTEIDGVLVLFVDLGNVDGHEVRDLPLSEEVLFVEDQLSLEALAQLRESELEELGLASEEHFLDGDLVPLQTLDVDDRLHHLGHALHDQLLQQGRVVVVVRAEPLQQRQLGPVEELHQRLVARYELVVAALVDQRRALPG